MVRRSSSCVIAAALLVVAACGSPTTPSGPASSSGSGPASAPAAVPTAQATPTPTPIAAGPAWSAVLEQIDADGTVSKDTALQAFALAFGGLPGVTVPPGDTGATASGTIAVRWLVSYWDELTPEQQAAAIEAIPELAGLAQTSDAPGHIVEAVERPAPVALRAPSLAQRRSNAFYTGLANGMISEIGARLTSPIAMGLTVEAHFGLPQQSISGMETGVFDAKGGISGKPAKCVIVVSALGDSQPDIDVEFMMAHEAWHCFEGAIVGLARYWSQNPAPWVIEGEASWVGAMIRPDAPLARESWFDYLAKPGLSLFSRSYSGIGFYSRLDAVGVDPWGKLRSILEAKSNAEAFTAAGADADPFLDSWASSHLDDESRGAPWDMTGPAVPDAKAKPADIFLSNGGSVEESAPAYANEIAVFGETPEVLLTTFSGRARLSDANGHDYLAGESGSFCMIPQGCVCPDAAGEPPPLPLEGDRVALGVTGGTAGATGTLIGMKLDDYCKKGIAGTWVGIWQNAEEWGGATGGFTLKVVQKGSTFTGTTDVTGPTCVRHGTVSGTVSKDGHISMGWVAARVRDVIFEGELKGDSMAGTWTAIACDLDLHIDGSWSAQRQK